MNNLKWTEMYGNECLEFYLKNIYLYICTYINYTKTIFYEHLEII